MACIFTPIFYTVPNAAAACNKLIKRQHIKLKLVTAVLAALILYDYICKKFLHVTGECIKAKCRLG